MRDALLSVPGVRNVEVSFPDQEAKVELDAAQATIADLVAALEGAGYRAWDTATEKRRGSVGSSAAGASAGTALPVR